MAGKKVSANGSEQTRKEIIDAGTVPVDAVIDQSQEVRAPEDEQWFQDMIILRRAAAELAERRLATATTAAPVLARDNSFYRFIEALGYSSEEHRNAAVRTLYDTNPERAASFFNMALRESSPESRRKLGAALIGSGLVSDAIKSLIGDGGKDSYSAFSLLFLAAKAGEIQPLVRAIENHPSIELRQKLVGLLASTSVSEIPSPLQKVSGVRAPRWNGFLGPGERL